MDLGIRGHVAVVQGASKGIGRGIAEALAKEGVHLVLTARTAETLRDASGMIAINHDVRVETVVADSGDLAAMGRIVDKAAEAFGRLDILICNSGGPPPGRFRDLTPDQWRAAAELLLVAPAALLRGALPLLEKSPAPRFFIVTSSSTREPVAGLTLSNTYRPGIVGLVKSLAQELAPQRVRCHSLAPGRIDTDRLNHVIGIQAQSSGRTPDQVREAMLASIPAGRLGTTADIGSLAAFLSSPHADYLTGLNWMVDGGLVKTI